MASSTPTEKLTIRSTMRDSTVSDSTAAPAMLPMPDSAVARRMPNKVVSKVMRT